MEFERLAPAKVNLFLHVGPLRADGYHPISSLMVFADIGDVVHIGRASRMDFSVESDWGEALPADGGNLVVRARDLVLGAYSRPFEPFRLTLKKSLPIAAGLGGGSADAAATLQLMDEAFGLAQTDEDEATFNDLPLKLGSDVPVCMESQPRIAEGRGEDLDYPFVFPDLDAVLVNPGVASPTGPVFAAYDAAGAPGNAETPTFPEPLETARAVAAFLSLQRNDLQAPAISLRPEIGAVLELLRGQPETLLARMSGSGATCFAICGSEVAAADLARRVAGARPAWWVRACRLGGFHP